MNVWKRIGAMFAFSPPEAAPTQADQPRPIFEAKPQPFANAVEVRAALRDEIDAQLEGARKKQAERWKWHNVGDIEAAACHDVLQMLDRLADEDNLDAYVQSCREGFLALAQRYRDDDWDEDGYGVGTIHAIHRVLD